MSLSSKLSDFKREQAATAARNIQHSRPKVNTPNAGNDAPKRTHESAFQPVSSERGHELFSHVNIARNYLKGKNLQVLPFSEICRHLSLPIDQEKNKPYIEQALQVDDRVEFIPKGTHGVKENSFKYRPIYPVTNAEELKDYLAKKQDAKGVPVKELKDGWPDCVPAINQLEQEKSILVLRHKKDNAPKYVWPDLSGYHIHVDSDFRDFWLKTKLPATENEIRNELEKAGITPTSQIKEMRKLNMMKKERKRPNRRGGRTTNTHMQGILKDYSRK